MRIVKVKLLSIDDGVATIVIQALDDAVENQFMLKVGELVSVGVETGDIVYSRVDWDSLRMD